MPDSIATLERQRTAILFEIVQLADFRSGSLTAGATAARLDLQAVEMATGAAAHRAGAVCLRTIPPNQTSFTDF